MPTVTIEESDLAKQKEDARLAAIAAKDAEVKAAIKDAGFDDLAKLVEAQKNAAKKISEHSDELGTLRRFKTEAEEKARLAAEAANGGGAASEKGDEDIVASITDEERKVLAELYVKNAKVKEAISKGGKKAQADAIRGLRDVKPQTVSDDNPFIVKKVASSAEELRDMIKKAIIVTERGVLGIGPESRGASNFIDEPNKAVVRGSMDSFKKVK